MDITTNLDDYDAPYFHLTVKNWHLDQGTYLALQNTFDAFRAADIIATAEYRIDEDTPSGKVTAEVEVESWHRHEKQDVNRDKMQRFHNQLMNIQEWFNA